MTTSSLRLGTRGGPAALAAAATVAAGLADAHEGLEVAMVVVATPDRGRTGTLDRELHDGRLDATVQRFEDIAGDEPVDGITTAAYLTRDDVHDCVIARDGISRLEALRPGARVGTGAARRTAHLARHFPHLRIVPVHGDVAARLSRLDADDADALILAVASVDRIGAAHRISEVLDLSQMAPAVGTGITVVRTRSDDTLVREAVAKLNHRPTEAAAFAERTMLLRLNGRTDSPVTGHATVEGKRLTLRGGVYAADGHRWLYASAEGHRVEAGLIGAQVAADLLSAGARDLIGGPAGPTRPRTTGDPTRTVGSSRRRRTITTGNGWR